MKRIALFLVAGIALGGCATSRTITGQDGKPLHKISCDGPALSMDACYEKAGELCGSAGFDIVNQAGQATPFFIAGGGTFSAGTMVTRTVLAQCREPKGLGYIDRSLGGPLAGGR
jgi:hypothetical protein